MSEHPFVKDQQIRCINPEPSKHTGLEKDKIYTIKTTFIGVPPYRHGDGLIPGMSETPGVNLIELGGSFTADRFTNVSNI